MKLFTIGPTEMFQTTKDVRENPVPYFRTDEFSQDMLELDRLLKQTMGAAPDSKTVYLTASGTAAMEALIINCFDAEDRLLVIAGGTFGNRFVQLCDIYKIPCDVIRLKEDEELTREHFAQYEDRDYRALLVNLHETATGQLYDIRLLKAFCREKNMYLMVDAISTFLCDPYKMEEWGISATIISTQKGLCVTPGMSMVVVSHELAQRILARPRACMYFDFKDYFSNIERGQTPFTPAVGIVYEILDMLRAIEKQGLENKLAHIAELARTYRKAVCGNGIFLPSFPMSNAITTTGFEKPVAGEIYRRLREEHEMCVNPSGGEFGARHFRVSHVGDLTKQDMTALAECIKKLYAQY